MNKLICAIAIATCGFSQVVTADTYTPKDWFWSKDNSDFFFAATINSSGHSIGQYCYFESGNCMYLVNLKVTCEVGHKYPALINSSSGAVHIEMVCSHEYEGDGVFAITPFDDIDNVVRQASRMGIVIPMEGDQFKVGRFSLAGSTYALDLMRAAAEQKNAKQTKPKPDKPDEEFF